MPIAFVTASGTTGATTATSLSINVANAGSFVIASIATRGAVNPSLTVNGTAVTDVFTMGSARFGYIIPGATGSLTVASTQAVAGAVALAAAVYTGIDVVDSTHGSSGTSSSPSLTQATTAADWLIGTLITLSSATNNSMTTGAGVTKRVEAINNGAAGAMCAIGDMQGGGVFAWTEPLSTSWWVWAVDANAAAAAANRGHNVTSWF